MLRKFCDEINEVLITESVIISKLKLLRDLLKTFLSTSEFRLNLVDHTLDTIDCWGDSVKTWNAPPLFFNEQLKYAIRLIFWPAFYENNPHEHKTWSVTGVFHNELTINTYKILQDPICLKKERTIIASKGEVGYLLPGCIHNVNNISHDLSASIHIFNHISSVNRPEENAIWYPSPRRHDLSKGSIDRTLMVCLFVAASIQTQQAFNLIDRIYALSSLTGKLMAVKFLYKFDPCHARQRFNELEAAFL